jgi:selenocysteine lyase/cysteine desulfurase
MIFFMPEDRKSGRFLALSGYKIFGPMLGVLWGKKELSDRFEPYRVETKKHLWNHHSIQIADGNHYSAVFSRHFRRDSVCRASFAHYNRLEDAEIFLTALEELLAKP